MKIIYVLLFFINVMSIYSNGIQQDRTAHSVDDRNLNSFERDCPDFWKVIRNNNLTEWTHCENKPSVNQKVGEEEVLQFACYLSKKMMKFICDNKINMTNEYLRAPENNLTCPFNFSHLSQLQFDIEDKLAFELKQEKHCLKVCYDLYEIRTKCFILWKLNNFLASFSKQIKRVGLVLPSVQNPPEINTPDLKTNLKADLVDNKQNEQKTNKATDVKDKTKTITHKDITSPSKVLNDETKDSDLEKPKLPVTSEKLDISKIPENIEISKAPENKNEVDLPDEETKELKIKPDDINPDDTFQNDDDMMEAPKGDMSELTVGQENMWEDEKTKVQTLFNRNKISSSDGFLQAEDSHFFLYFIVVSSIIVMGYIGFHNKNKILAYALEGTSARRSRRRPNPARYRKLETNLEEAISSNASETIASSVVY